MSIEFSFICKSVIRSGYGKVVEVLQILPAGLSVTGA